MKLQFRFLLLLLFTFGAIGALLVVQRSFDLERTHQVMASELNQRKILFESNRAAEGKTFQSFSEDYSFWDDMVAFVQNGNAAFARDNLESGLETFGADLAWVYRPDGTLVYQTQSGADIEVPVLPTSMDFFASVTKDRFDHFYLKTEQGVVEIRAATIVPTTDPEHKTTPRGYWVIGRYLDDEYIKALGASSQAQVAILDPDQSSADVIASNAATFQTPLLDASNVTTAILSSSVKISVLDDLNVLYRRELIALVGISGVLITLVSLAIWILVLRPLHLIERSIKLQRPRLLDPLAGKNTQFGDLAQVVQQFFAQKLTIEQAEFKKAELEERNRDKAAFLSITAHELKGPISIVKLLSEDLPKNEIVSVDPTLVHTLDIITHQSHKIATLINDLRMAGAGHDSLSYQFETVEFDTFLAAEISETAFIIDQKLTQEGKTGALVLADPNRLSQVVSNLIRNASKYSPGTDEIIIRHEIKDGFVVVEFEDFGVGIAAEDQKRIFERFYRAPSVEKSFQGLGLGLSVCQSIIEFHNGKIWLESSVGHGTSFFISIPLADGTTNKAV